MSVTDPLLVVRRHIDFLRIRSAICLRHPLIAAPDFWTGRACDAGLLLPPLVTPGLRLTPKPGGRGSPRRAAAPAGLGLTRVPEPEGTSRMPVGQTGTKRRKRGEGQWALGYREPLNKNEENKRNDDGLNVRQRIIDIYSKYGFDSIDPADLRGRFRWYGLYTQRRPGIDGGKTAVLEPEELDDRYFMLRVRIDGGQLTNDQLRAIAYISRRYARGTADVTDRQNIQLHWVEIENVPDIWDALESVGLSTTEACGDTPRVILGCPLAGIDADEIIDGTPEIAAIGEQYIGDSAFSNLPRKFKSSISGCSAQCAIHEINDIAFVGVVNAAR